MGLLGFWVSSTGPDMIGVKSDRQDFRGYELRA